MSYLDIKKRIRRRKIRFRIFLFLLLISAVAIYLFRTPVFKVKSINITGNSVIPVQTITELSGIQIGDNLLRLNIKKINNNIKANSYIENSKIKINLLGDINIIVSERQVAGVSNFNDRYVTMDKNGVIIEVLDNMGGLNIPIIEGLDIISAVPGNTVEVSDVRKLNTLKVIFDNITDNDFSGIINKIELNNLVSIIVKTKYNIDFKLGDIENIETKLERCRIIMEQELIKNKLEGTIDVSFKGNPVFIPKQQPKLPEQQ